MNTPTEPPRPYDVSITGRVFDKVRELAAVARARGDGETFLAAVQEFYRRLRIYPQFGEQLYDLKAEPGQVWIGTVRPLGMRYTVYDDLRRVTV